MKLVYSYKFTSAIFLKNLQKKDSYDSVKNEV